MCECVRECVWAGVTAVGGVIDWNQGKEKGGRDLAVLKSPRDGGLKII